MVYAGTLPTLVLPLPRSLTWPHPLAYALALWSGRARLPPTQEQIRTGIYECRGMIQGQSTSYCSQHATYIKLKVYNPGVLVGGGEGVPFVWLPFSVLQCTVKKSLRTRNAVIIRTLNQTLHSSLHALPHAQKDKEGPSRASTSCITINKLQGILCIMCSRILPHAVRYMHMHTHTMSHKKLRQYRK